MHIHWEKVKYYWKVPYLQYCSIFRQFGLLMYKSQWIMANISSLLEESEIWPMCLCYLKIITELLQEGCDDGECDASGQCKCIKCPFSEARTNMRPSKFFPQPLVLDTHRLGFRSHWSNVINLLCSKWSGWDMGKFSGYNRLQSLTLKVSKSSCY